MALFRDLGVISLSDFVCEQSRQWELCVNNYVPDTILFAEHPPTVSVSTRKTSRDLKYLKVSRQCLADRDISLIALDRGGSIAVHGPGILGCYFVFRAPSTKAASALMCHVEEWLIKQFAPCGIVCTPYPRDLPIETISPVALEKYRGLWHTDKKIAAKGFRIARHVSQFGYTINVNPSQKLLDLIHPCSITKPVLGSLHEAIGKAHAAKGRTLPERVRRKRRGKHRR